MCKTTDRFAKYLGFAFISLSLAACGNISNLATDLASLSSNDDTSEETQIQSEVQSVVQQAQVSIIGSILSAVTKQNISFGSCKPNMDIGFVSVSLNFSRSDACQLDGNIQVSLFPLPIQARVDLDVFGTGFVESMRFDTDITLRRDSGGLNFGWQFTNGQINIKSSTLFPVTTLTLSGIVNSQVKRGSFAFNSRTNLFDPSSGKGIALITEIKRERSTATRSRKLEACALSDANGEEPLSGSLTNCVSRAKN